MNLTLQAVLTTVATGALLAGCTDAPAPEATAEAHEPADTETPVEAGEPDKAEELADTDTLEGTDGDLVTLDDETVDLEAGVHTIHVDALDQTLTLALTEPAQVSEVVAVGDVLGMQVEREDVTATYFHTTFVVGLDENFEWSHEAWPENFSAWITEAPSANRHLVNQLINEGPSPHYPDAVIFQNYVTPELIEAEMPRRLFGIGDLVTDPEDFLGMSTNDEGASTGWAVLDPEAPSAMVLVTRMANYELFFELLGIDVDTDETIVE